jgi:hypothetical protein
VRCPLEAKRVCHRCQSERLKTRLESVFILWPEGRFLAALASDFLKNVTFKSLS